MYKKIDSEAFYFFISKKVNMSEHIPPTYLAEKNPHSRDKDISFEEGPHIYTVKGNRGGYTSVTTWNHSHFSHFDSEAIVDKMLKSKKMENPTYKYYGKTKEEILKMWDDKRIASSTAGTKMHNDIEYYYNKEEVNNDSKEFGFFKNFLKDYPDLKPYRTEWMIFHEELMLSGSIDMIYENEDGSLQIYDWKRVEELKHEPEFNKYATTHCISHLPDTNFWHYALQLNVYKAILESKYDKKITDLYLVCLHPDNVYKNYQRIKVPILDKEIEELFKYRLLQVEKETNEKRA